MSIPTPNDTTITAAIKAILDAVFDGIVYDEWKLALVAGESLNAARPNDSAHARAICFDLLSQKQERITPVPDDPAAAARMTIKRDCTWVYRFRYVEGYTDKLVEGKQTKQLFSERIQLLIDAFSASPKLRLGRHCTEHDELQITSRLLPAYGREHAHTADMTLTIHFYSSITPGS